MSKTRRNCTPEFKAKVVLELPREEMTFNELSGRHQISSVLISRWKAWKAEFLEGAAEVFRKGSSDAEKVLVAKEEYIADLEQKIGQSTVEVDWLKKSTEIFERKTAPGNR